MRENDKDLTELTVGFERYPQVLVNVRVREKIPFADLEAVKVAARDIEKRLGDNGRLLLRYSGTEPLARVMIEGASQTEIEAYADQLASVIRDEIGER